MECPKERGIELSDHVLPGGLAVKHCPSCAGNWLPVEDYTDWQQQQPATNTPATNTPAADTPAVQADLPYTPSLLDSRTALCPNCRGFLSRARVGSANPFYVERCPQCGGMWCDRGEWEALAGLGLHTMIDQLFSSDWQSRMRERELTTRERLALIDKLGSDLAQQIFELAEQLEKHPNGDFGVAYLMRRLDK